ncbi:MAG TPA: TrmH family RNA methyltransferase [Candidatus Moranbacteria bacterium]|nr:TrmH family RNA methyltransferase [Candidatus Moranbacteria bacterium]
MKKIETKFYLILHRIRSAYNVGSMFRTADGAGIDKIFLTGFTQTPSNEEYNLQTRAEKMLSKTALQADKYVPWEQEKNISKLIDNLKLKGFEIIALEQSIKSIDYRKFKPKDKIALIVGNEPRGIDMRILKKCDNIIEIPMRGKKKSLNVAVALGIASYAIKR